MGPSYPSARGGGGGECRGEGREVLKAVVFHCQVGKCGISEYIGKADVLKERGRRGEIRLFALQRAFPNDWVSAGETFTKTPRQ